MSAGIESYRRIDQLTEPTLAVRYPRTGGYRPSADENPLNAWCGAYGLKPTYGLVPYTGVFPIELTLDHTGPIAANTADVALFLEAIAGEDGLDPRQKDVKVEAYTRALANDTEGLRIGIVTEGFGWPGLSEQDVDALVEASARRFSELGARVSTISIPLHRDGIHI